MPVVLYYILLFSFCSWSLMNYTAREDDGE